VQVAGDTGTWPVFSLIDASWVREPSSFRKCSVFMVFFFSLVAELGVASRRLHYSGAMREPVARTGAHAKHVTSGVRPGRRGCCEGVTVCSVGQAAHTTVLNSLRVPPSQSEKRSHSHTDISARRPLSAWHVLCGREDRIVTVSAWRRETARGNPKLTGEKKSTMKTD
jgi:hypothetical protein